MEGNYYYISPRKGDIVMEDDLETPLGEVESQIVTQLMHSVAILTSKINPKKCTNNRGGFVNGNY